MTFVIETYVGLLLGAFIIGAVTGWFIWFKSSGGASRYAAWLLAAVILFGFSIAVLRLAPGRLSYTPVLAVSLLVGCGLGCLCAWALRNRAAARGTGSSGLKGAHDSAGSPAGSALYASDAGEPSASTPGAADIAAVQVSPAAPTGAADHNDVGSPRADVMEATGAQTLDRPPVDVPADTPQGAGPPAALPETIAAPMAATMPPDVTGARAALTMATTLTGRLGATSRAVASAAPADSPVYLTAPAPRAPGAGASPQSIPTPPAAAPTLTDLPSPALTVPDEHRHPGRRPEGYLAPRSGAADDLKRIKGIGKQNEARLHSLGIWHFDQIAAWTPDNMKWVGSYLAFAGRIERERWIEQARALASGIEPAVSQRPAADTAVTSTDDAALAHSDTQRVKRRRR